MKILVSGSHGLVGKALVRSLTDDGHEVMRLVRGERAFGSPEVEWHPDQGRIDVEHLEGIHAVVHLAGESIASGRWTDEKKAGDSRKSRQGDNVVERIARTFVSTAVSVSQRVSDWLLRRSR